jgi:hypothetical protein
MIQFAGVNIDHDAAHRLVARVIHFGAAAVVC